VKEGLSFYQDIVLDQKFSMLRAWLEEAVLGTTMQLEEVEHDEILSVRETDGTTVEFVKLVSRFMERQGNDAQRTLCCVENKRYTKRLTDIEQRLLKSLSSNKARFLAY
jgi:hypothetical protein